MTDQTNTTKLASGSKKASLLGIYMIGCQNATPKIVGLIALLFPTTFNLFGESFFYESIVLSESIGATFLIWVNWNNLVSTVVDGIKAVRDAKQKIKDAAEKE